ncbi:MAG: putative metal-binding motif-containing protein [Bacteroidetes bacterium]|nr:putative metal-binding motif-containing protein [Bacteroidota bacterium]
MRKSTFRILSMMFVLQCIQLLSFAQAPQRFNYQGIARDVNGLPFKNQQIALKLSILNSAEAIEADYEEIQQVTTNEFGLYTLQIGNGKSTNRSLKMVKWETGNKYIKVAIDPTGGNDFIDMGTSQLLSVPYAMYADKAGETLNNEKEKTRSGAVNSSAGHVAGDANFLSKFTSFNTIGKSLLFDNGSSIGIGTASPTLGTKMHIFTATGNVEHLRMQNSNASGFGKFVMYNDNPNNYATFTKYGSSFPGGYPNVVSQYPFANLLAFGNNVGPFILANNGNVGIAVVTGGVTNLKFNAHQSTGYLGLGGSFTPSANVHINHASTGDTMRVTNATTGHLNTDGLEIRTTGNAAAIINKENSTLTLGTNNNNVMTLTNTGRTDFAGQIKIAGGNPGLNKVLTSDATGIASWQTPNLNNIIQGANVGDVLVWNGTEWVLTPKCNLYNYFFRDEDGDGFGDKFKPIVGCNALPGFVIDSTDCNDGAPSVNPNTVWFQDLDADNFGNAAVTVTSCTQPNGFILNNEDCNDNNNLITTGTLFFQDLDNDTFGNPLVSVTACTQPIGFVSNSLDCNDNNPNITAGITYFQDLDGDNFGNLNVSVTSCTQPQGFVTNSADCNDANININPLVSEICNTIDDDCDGIVDEGFNLNTDVNNCGFCGNACIVANGTSICVFGQCQIGSCFPGFMDVNGVVADGCEVNLSLNCVIFGQVIPNGTNNPNNPCQSCNTALNNFNWSNKPNGTACPGGQCTNGVCNN